MNAFALRRHGVVNHSQAISRQFEGRDLTPGCRARTVHCDCAEIHRPRANEWLPRGGRLRIARRGCPGASNSATIVTAQKRSIIELSFTRKVRSLRERASSRVSIPAAGRGARPI